MKHKDYEIARDQKHEGFQRAVTSMAYTFFDKKIGLSVSVNEEPAEELHKPVIKIFKRRKSYSRFEDNIWVADLAEMI